jgi:hypothetical protein
MQREVRLLNARTGMADVPPYDWPEVPDYYVLGVIDNKASIFLHHPDASRNHGNLLFLVLRLVSRVNKYRHLTISSKASLRITGNFEKATDRRVRD